MGLSDVRTSYPWQLSGGMQQRVAIARTLALRPGVVLMDEPFASVDAQTRAELEDLLLTLQRDLGITVLLVTHDVEEALLLADRALLLRDGRIAGALPAGPSEETVMHLAAGEVTP